MDTRADIRKPVLIGCPQYQRPVRGSYACGADGEYLLGPGGEFLVEHVRCGHNGGRCMQTLCVLHRYNRGGPGAWYPGTIRATRQGRRRSHPAGGPAPGASADGDGWLA